MLVRSTLREIRTSLARYLAIFAIVALGVGFFAGLKDCKPSMLKTARDYVRDYRLYDYQIATSYGIDSHSVEIAEGFDGVREAEGSVQIDVMAETGEGDSVALKSISLPTDINKLRLVSGRLPESPDECVVDNYSMATYEYSEGQSIRLSEENDKETLKEFKNTEFKIVGTVNTPIYLDYQRGSTDIGNGSLTTFFFIPKEAYDVDYYTQLYVKLEGDEEAFSSEYEDMLKAKESDMEDLAADINDARREDARREAQDELDEKKKEYEGNLAEYESEKANAETEIRKARNEINNGRRAINAKRNEINATISDLNSKIKEGEEADKKLAAGIGEGEKNLRGLKVNKSDIEKGLAEYTKKRSEVETAHAAGYMDDASYNASIAEIDAGEKDLKSKLSDVNAGIKKAEDSLKEAEKTRKTVADGLAKARAGLGEANAGLDTLSSKEAELSRAESELDSKEAEANAEFADAEKKLDDARDKIDEAQEKIDDMETGNSYAFSVTDNTGYSSFDSNSSIVDNISKIFPVFFFLIAALVCMTTMTRMVDEQRTQIGILKALGYGNAAIAGKYLFYSGSAAFLGSIAGFLIGCKVFPAVIWNAYTMMYDFSEDVDFVFDPKLGLISLATALLCCMGATWLTIRKDFKVASAELIRPKTPPAGKRILMERIKPLWSRISFLYKVSIRNIFRDKKRFLMMVIGVSGCTALLIAGMGIKTTIAEVANYQFNEISLYDFSVIFTKNMNEKRQAEFTDLMKDAGASESDVKFIHQAEITVIMDGGNTDVTCTAADPQDFDRYINLHNGGEHIDFPGAGEVVVVKKLQHDYGINAGDEITVRDGFKKATFRVSGVADNYVFDTIYMSEDTYEQAFGKKPEIKTALVIAGEDAEEDKIRAMGTAAAGYDDAAAVSVNIDTKDNVNQMMKSLNSVVYVVILSAALLAFIVLYNLTNINITERVREIATIKVLGFYQLETSLYVFRENFFLTAIAAVVGIPLGKWLLKFVIDNIVIKMIFFEPKLSNLDMVLSVVLTFLFAFAVNLVMQRRLANISMTESLKSVE